MESRVVATVEDSAEVCCKGRPNDDVMTCSKDPEVKRMVGEPGSKDLDRGFYRGYTVQQAAVAGSGT